MKSSTTGKRLTSLHTFRNSQLCASHWKISPKSFLMLCLYVVGRIVFPYDPYSCAGGSLLLLEGSTMSDGLCLRGQADFVTRVLRFFGRLLTILRLGYWNFFTAEILPQKSWKCKWKAEPWTGQSQKCFFDFARLSFSRRPTTGQRTWGLWLWDWRPDEITLWPFRLQLKVVRGTNKWTQLRKKKGLLLKRKSICYYRWREELTVEASL